MSRKGSRPAAGETADTAVEVGYEQARDELARVVATLEAGGLGLEESLVLWERGEELARRCRALLAGAEERIQQVLAEHPLDDEAEDTGDPEDDDDDGTDEDDPDED